MFGHPAGWDSSPCEGHHKWISKHHQRTHNRMDLHWLSRFADKKWRRASSTDQCVWQPSTNFNMYPMFHRNPEGKPALGIRYSWMKTRVWQWNGIYRGTAKKPIFFPKFLNCAVKLSFHHPLIKSTLLDSLNLTTAPQTMLIVSFVLIPCITGTIDRVHTYGMTV